MSQGTLTSGHSDTLSRPTVLPESELNPNTRSAAMALCQFVPFAIDRPRLCGGVCYATRSSSRSWEARSSQPVAIYFGVWLLGCGGCGLRVPMRNGQSCTSHSRSNLRTTHNDLLTNTKPFEINLQTQKVRPEDQPLVALSFSDLRRHADGHGIGTR